MDGGGGGGGPRKGVRGTKRKDDDPAPKSAAEGASADGATTADGAAAKKAESGLMNPLLGLYNAKRRAVVAEAEAVAEKAAAGGSNDGEGVENTGAAGEAGINGADDDDKNGGGRTGAFLVTDPSNSANQLRNFETRLNNQINKALQASCLSVCAGLSETTFTSVFDAFANRAGPYGQNDFQRIVTPVYVTTDVFFWIVAQLLKCMDAAAVTAHLNQSRNIVAPVSATILDVYVNTTRALENWHNYFCQPLVAPVAVPGGFASSASTQPQLPTSQSIIRLFTSQSAQPLTFYSEAAMTAAIRANNNLPSNNYIQAINVESFTEGGTINLSKMNSVIGRYVGNAPAVAACRAVFAVAGVFTKWTTGNFANFQTAAIAALHAKTAVRLRELATQSAGVLCDTLSATAKKYADANLLLQQACIDATLLRADVTTNERLAEIGSCAIAANNAVAQLDGSHVPYLNALVDTLKVVAAMYEHDHKLATPLFTDEIGRLLMLWGNPRPTSRTAIVPSIEQPAAMDYFRSIDQTFSNSYTGTAVPGWLNDLRTSTDTLFTVAIMFNKLWEIVTQVCIWLQTGEKDERARASTSHSEVKRHINSVIGMHGTQLKTIDPKALEIATNLRVADPAIVNHKDVFGCSAFLVDFGNQAEQDYTQQLADMHQYFDRWSSTPSEKISVPSTFGATQENLALTVFDSWLRIAAEVANGTQLTNALAAETARLTGQNPPITDPAVLDHLVPPLV